MGKTKIPFRVASVKRFDELRNMVCEFKKQERFSKFPLFQEYIKELNFQLPEKFKDAKSVILIASPKKMAKVNFHYGTPVYKSSANGPSFQSPHGTPV